MEKEKAKAKEREMQNKNNERKQKLRKNKSNPYQIPPNNKKSFEQKPYSNRTSTKTYPQTLETVLPCNSPNQKSRKKKYKREEK